MKRILSTILFLSVGINTQASEIQAWPSFRGNWQNSGKRNINAREFHHSQGANRLVESFATKGLIWATAVTDTLGNIYLGSADKYFYSFTKDFKLRFKYKLLDRADSLIDSAALVHSKSNLIIVPGGDGNLHALDRTTGKKQWLFTPDEYSDDDHQQGKVVNSFEGNVSETPEGNICAGSDNGYMYCLKANGKKMWSFKTGMMIWSLPTYSSTSNWMAFGSLDKKVYLLDRTTGKMLDSFKAKGEVKASLHFKLEDNQQYVYFGDSQGFIYKLLVNDENKFEKIWRVKFDGEIYSSATSDERNIYFGTLKGEFHSVSTTGKKMWSFNAYSPISSSPVLTNDHVLLFGAKNGKLYALDALNGSRLWSYKTSEKTYKANLDASPLITNDGEVINGSYSGNVFRIPLEYCHKNLEDKNCEFGLHQDIPEIIGNLPDGEHLLWQDELGNLKSLSDSSSTEIIRSAGAPIKLRLIVKEKGQWLNQASFHPWFTSVKIDGKKSDYKISSDGEWIDILPNNFTKESLRLKVKASYFKKTHWLWDRLKIIPRGSFKKILDIRFTEKVGSQHLQDQLVEENSFLGIRSMALLRPASLDTYIPAALDGQNFIVKILKNDQSNEVEAIVLPAFHNEGKYQIMPEATKAFVFSGVISEKGELILKAPKFSLSAMGATIPFTEARFNLPLVSPLTGEFYAAANCLKLKGNGLNYKFTPELIDATCDHLFRLHSLGMFEADIVKMEELNSSLNTSLSAKSKKGYELLITGHAPVAILHLKIKTKKETTWRILNWKNDQREAKLLFKEKPESVSLYLNGHLLK